MRTGLSWTDNSSTESGFEIHRSTTSGSGYILLARVASDVTTYTDDNTTSGNAYYYMVKAYNPGGGSTETNEVGNSQ